MRSPLLKQISAATAHTHYMKAVIPKSIPGELDVLGAPYYGPIDGRDYHGEYFTPETDFQTDLIPLPPVFYYHGSATGNTATPIGVTTDRWEDNLGVWFRVALDMSKPEARRVWQAAQAGKAYGSTGGVQASIVVDPNGEIQQWLIGELSLLDMDEDEGRQPANRYAIALPRMKALLDELPPEQRQLFDKVYQIGPEAPVPTDEGGTDVDVIEMLQAIFARVIEELSAAMQMSTEEAASTVQEAATNAADEAASSSSAPPELDNTKCSGCKSEGCKGEGCSGCPDCMKAAETESMKAEETEPATNALKAVMDQNAMLQQQLAQRDDADWVKEQVRLFRLTPAESQTTLQALTAARQADHSLKAADMPTLNALKVMVESRPGKYAPSDMNGKGLKLAGFQNDQSVTDRIDGEYMKRVRLLAGLPETE